MYCVNLECWSLFYDIVLLFTNLDFGGGSSAKGSTKNAILVNLGVSFFTLERGWGYRSLILEIIALHVKHIRIRVQSLIQGLLNNIVLKMITREEWIKRKMTNCTWYCRPRRVPGRLVFCCSSPPLPRIPALWGASILRICFTKASHRKSWITSYYIIYRPPFETMFYLGPICTWIEFCRSRQCPQ